MFYFALKRRNIFSPFNKNKLKIKICTEGLVINTLGFNQTFMKKVVSQSTLVNKYIFTFSESKITSVIISFAIDNDTYNQDSIKKNLFYAIYSKLV